MGGAKTRVALVAADDRVHGVEDRDVDDGHGPTRSPGPHLLSEDATVAGRHQGVVEATGVDGELVPVAEVTGRARAVSPPAVSEVAETEPRAEAWPVCVTEAAGESLGARGNRQAEREHAEQEGTTR